MERDMVAFGRAIRKRRLRLGLSQAAAARQWGVGRTWLSALERGRANPTFGQLVALAEGMEATLADLFREAHDLAGGERDKR
jgi:transcriptional regulator with XRE-family HTH domain